MIGLSDRETNERPGGRFVVGDKAKRHGQRGHKRDRFQVAAVVGDNDRWRRPLQVVETRDRQPAARHDQNQP
jgi:hypothetical protein